GLGEDGHTASLFPGAVAVHGSPCWVRAEYVQAVSAWRVTLTPITFNAAAEVAFLVTGVAKAPILRQVLEGPWRPYQLPAQLIAPTAGRVRWFVDAPAARVRVAAPCRSPGTCRGRRSPAPPSQPAGRTARCHRARTMERARSGPREPEPRAALRSTTCRPHEEPGASVAPG